MFENGQTVCSHDAGRSLDIIFQIRALNAEN
jgi:hypothetical protein